MARKRDQKSSTSATPPRLVAQRDKAQADTAADRDKAPETPAEQGGQIEQEPPNTLALILGLVVVLILIFGSLFIIDRMRCDPLYSDAGLLRPNSCR